MMINQPSSYQARQRFWLQIGGVILLLLTFLVTVAYAQNGYPEPDELYINDYAGLLNDRDRANSEKLLVDLRETHGIEATVLTIRSLADYDTGDETIETFATNLFNTWGIGNREANDGVLLLVAIDDRQVRIELGSGYENEFNDDMQEVINEHILPSFREGEFSRGIYRGVRAIVGELTGDWPSDLSVVAATASSSSTSQANDRTQASTLPTRAVGRTRSEPSVTGRRDDSGLPFGWLLGGGAVTAAGAAGLGLRHYLRHRKRRCPDCQTDMIRLDEAADDVYLDSGQKLEELLDSIDYDVWKCPNCNVHTVTGYKNWFSGLRQCHQCRYRTLKVTSTILEHPTYTSTGREKITKDCQHCDYHYEDIVILPMKTRSDDNDSGSSSFSSRSSSSSSFGGGSSSGGGASGSW